MSGGSADTKEKEEAMSGRRRLGQSSHPFHEAKGRCPKCNTGDSVYAGGHCFKCGTYLAGGKKVEVGGNRDAYDYMQMTYGSRLLSSKWMDTE